MTTAGKDQQAAARTADEPAGGPVLEMLGDGDAGLCADGSCEVPS